MLSFFPIACTRYTACPQLMYRLFYTVPTGGAAGAYVELPLTT